MSARPRGSLARVVVRRLPPSTVPPGAGAGMAVGAMTVTITFPQPAERLSMNGRYHWRVRSARAKAWRTATYWASAAAFSVTSRAARGPSYVRVTFPVRDNRRRDADNPAPTVKAIVDGLVDAGVWPDDTPEWVETLGSRFAKGADVVTVELIPREGL